MTPMWAARFQFCSYLDIECAWCQKERPSHMQLKSVCFDLFNFTLNFKKPAIFTKTPANSFVVFLH